MAAVHAKSIPENSEGLSVMISIHPESETVLVTHNFGL